MQQPLRWIWDFEGIPPARFTYPFMSHLWSPQFETPCFAPILLTLSALC